MKTIDTSKPWHVHAATEEAHPEIVGPGGICMDVYDATTEQAQEIADILNGAVDPALFSVSYREGEVEVTYSGSAADEVMWMARQGEQETTAPPAPETAVSITDAGSLVFDESTKLFTQGRQGGKTTAMLTDAANRIQELSKELERYKTLVKDCITRRMALTRERDCALNEMAHYKTLAEERNDYLINQGRKIDTLESNLSRANTVAEKLQYERNAWEETAAGYLRSMTWYQEQLDRCGVALGHEAYVSDDGSVQDKPLRAKVAEMVEKLCAERAKSAEVVMQVGDAYDHAEGHLTDAQRAQVHEAAKRYASDGFVSAPDGNLYPPVLMRGPCAKQTVTATIIAKDGRRFVGTNDCANPKDYCAREIAGSKTGEDYHLCKDICQQTGHAEINAIKAAGAAARGATMYIEGHTYACEPCRKAMAEAGIHHYTTGAPPEAQNTTASAADINPLPEDLPSRLTELAQAAEGRIWESVTRSMREAAQELKSLREKTQCTLGVGNGSGNLFVRGDYDSIKAAQRLIDRPYIPDVPTMRDAFITYESGTSGSRMVFKFNKLDEMQQAGREWNVLHRALLERAK